MDLSNLISRLSALKWNGSAKVDSLVQKPAVGMHALVDVAHVVAGKGFDGDHTKKDWWKGERVPGREVTAITREVLDALGAGPEVPGDNIVTKGVDLKSLQVGQLVRIGNVILRRADKIHRPCDLFARRISQEAKEAVLALQLRGALFHVEQGGTIQKGDPIQVMPREVALESDRSTH